MKRVLMRGGLGFVGLGNNFEQGLKHLKAEAEKRRAAEQEATQQAAPAVP